MLEHALEALVRIEAEIRTPSPDAVLPPLRRALGLDDFGELMISLPMAEFPMLSRALPPMASETIQNEWTGANGIALLRHSAAFVRTVAYSYTRLTRRPLDGARMLDYGCGYGRLARLMYYFTDPANLFGVDPWDRSIEICREAGLGANFLLSDYLPRSLPVPDIRFDLIYAFSVFTHLSPRAIAASLAACRRAIAADGVLVITVRPVEYWDAPLYAQQDMSALRATHRATGFAFAPHQRPPVDGDITYGDTSMTAGWLAANFPDWEVVGTDRSLDDPYQIYVFLRPR